MKTENSSGHAPAMKSKTDRRNARKENRRMNMKKIVCFALSLCMALTLAACGVTASIPREYTVETGQTVRLSVTPESDPAPEDFEETLAAAGIRWESADPDVATVDGDGCVTGVSAGETFVTARSEAYRLDSVCHVTVVAREAEPGPEPEEVPAALKMALDGGQADAAQALVLAGLEIPGDADAKTLKWASDNEAVATVDENGHVTPVGLGSCTVSVAGTLADGSEWSAALCFMVCESIGETDENVAPLVGESGDNADESASSAQADKAAESAFGKTTSKTSGGKTSGDKTSSDKTSGDKTSGSTGTSSQARPGSSGSGSSGQGSQGSTSPSAPQTPSGACPICGSTYFVNGQCQTIHDYSGYGHCTYDAATNTVYVHCNSCGQTWPRGTFADSYDFVRSHGQACYEEHNKSYMACAQCGALYEEGTEPEILLATGYCSTACQLASGYYCPNCLSALYIDGCHNCGYGQTPEPEQPEPTPVPEQPQPTPVPEQPQPTPVPEQPQPTPVPEQPQPTPAPEQSQPTPAPEQSQPTADANTAQPVPSADGQA